MKTDGCGFRRLAQFVHHLDRDAARRSGADRVDGSFSFNDADLEKGGILGGEV